MDVPIWHGTEEQKFEILTAIEHWCKDNGDGEHCVFGKDGVKTTLCSAHRMLLNQESLDFLVYGKSIAQRITDEEFRKKR